MKIIISLAQMDIVLGQPEANFAKAWELTIEAKRRDSDIVVLPELWSTGYDLENAAKHATGLNEGLFARIAQSAREEAIHITGSLLMSHDGRHFYNAAPSFPRQASSWVTTARSTYFAPWKSIST